MRAVYVLAIACGITALFSSVLFFAGETNAINVRSYKDTISTSRPSVPANHTFTFTLLSALPPGGYFEFTPPAGFTTVSSSTFSYRNVQLFVNGVARTAGASVGPGTDGVTITDGSPGSIRYTLNNSVGISANAQIEVRIGNHTTTSQGEQIVIVGTSSTTTIPGDLSGLTNAAATGTHHFAMVGVGGAEPIETEFVIALIEQVGVGPVDTTELIPPVRTNGTPSGNISGTSLNVELSLNTDEFAQCRYSATPGVDYASMSGQFNSSGLIIHSGVIVPVTPNTTYTYYVRCIDDEGNFNIDDYEITFFVQEAPSGVPNSEGDVEGDGTGSGNDGTGQGDGGGGTQGGTEGEEDTSGQSQGGGGSGGGGGGGGGNKTGSEPGGGFYGDGPYESGDGRVFINGTAYPRSTVTILVDGQSAETTRAGADGSFSATIDEIARGAYTFGIYATDSSGVRSSTFSTSFTVSGARASSLSNINLAPSIKVDPDPVPAGGNATMSGYAQPGATIALETQSDKSSAGAKSLSATADANGFWNTSYSAAGLAQGTYKVRAQATLVSGTRTNFSQWTLFGVGVAATRASSADLNSDGRVNLTDFSILLFWWGTDGGASNPSADINSDSNVSLTDFSILLFNWTG